MNQNQEGLLIGNGNLITRDPACPFIQNGAVMVKGSVILRTGKTDELKRAYPKAEFLDAKGMLIMPGYINAHNHIYSSFARGLSIPGKQPSNFLEILEHTWWKIDRNLTVEQTFCSAEAAFLESVRNGVTTVIDHHASFGEIKGSLSAISEAAKELGIRNCLCYEISDRDGEEKMLQAVEENFRFIEETEKNKSTMQKALVGMHASFTLSDRTLDLCKERNIYGTGYHIHIAEGEYDNTVCKEQHGCSVVERLYKKGILGSKTVAGHCIHISEEDMDILKETHTTVIHNPESNMGNAVGCPDILKMYDKGILLGLGTDGYTNDMMESVKVANLLQKHNSQNPSRGFVEAADMLFQNNARIASSIFGTEIGILKEGAQADIILVDYHPYTPLNQDNIDGHLMFGVNGAMTDTTIIAGKLCMKNRTLISDEKKILENCRKKSADLWRKLYE